MAGEDDGDARVRPFPEHVGHHVHGNGIEPGEGLVEHQHLRPEDQGRGELDPLLVAEAEGLELAVAPLGQAEALQPAQRSLPCLSTRHPVQLAEVRQLLRHAHLGVQAALLGHVADPPAGLEGQGHAQPAHRSGVGREHAQHHPHRRGLAGAVAPHEPEQLPGTDLEGQPVYGDGLAVPLRDVVDLEDPTSSHGSPPGSPAIRSRSAAAYASSAIRPSEVSAAVVSEAGPLPVFSVSM